MKNLRLGKDLKHIVRLAANSLAVLTVAGSRAVCLSLFFAINLSIAVQTPALADTASWYSTRSCKSEGTSGIFTASGARFDENSFTCASPNLPFGSRLKITNLKNKKSIVVTVTDRGPTKRLVKKGRVIDLAKGAFKAIAPLSDGVIPVKVEAL